MTWIAALDMALLGFSVACAVVARNAAADARRVLRELVLDQERTSAELEGLLVRLRRVEGRQTARQGREPARNADSQPDPKVDPEGWKAWQNRQLALRGRIQ